MARKKELMELTEDEMFGEAQETDAGKTALPETAPDSVIILRSSFHFLSQIFSFYNICFPFSISFKTSCNLFH